ncbi:MAG: transcription elongation factor GreA [Deltaproteobacteria bacterium]|nr:transcription elongation factor GreA [Deltaproteobacteria bacterium]
MSDRYPMTPQGFKKMRDELRECKAERPRLAEVILAARELGDLSENAEYHAAKERQGFLEGRISELETKIAQADVIDPSKVAGDRVAFGATVGLEDVDSGKPVKYTIVGEDEADAKAGRISLHSPVARALLGHRVGDEVLVRTPGGERSLEITELSFVALEE